MQPSVTSPEILDDKSENEQYQNELFESNDEMKKSLTRLCNGDLYLIGRIWIEAIKIVLIGAKFNLIPVVEAAKAPEPPKKPPSMKYTDLPLYQSPHYEYKDYVEDKKNCPDANVKLLHRFLYPYVRCYRQVIEQNMCEFKCAIVNGYHNASCSVNSSKDEFKKTMRDPNNLAVRQAVVAVGGVTGYLLGAGGGIPRRLFVTGVGLLSAGALCFPKETDEAFRNFAFYAGKTFLLVYNRWCGQDYRLRERLACRSDLPPPPPYRKPVQCPPKK